MKTSVLLLLCLACVNVCGGECRFFRVGCIEGDAPENLAITSDEVGEIFLEFDTAGGHTYIIQSTDRLFPSPVWTTVGYIKGNGGRLAFSTAPPWVTLLGGNRDDRATSVQQTRDGGYIVAGRTDGMELGDRDMYLVKTDPNGAEVWSRTFGGSGWDEAHSVQQTRDGGYIVAGYTRSFGAGSYDMYLVKTDPNGVEVWSQTFGGSSSDWAYSVRQTSDGGYIVAGGTMSMGAGEFDMYLVKTDPNGVEVWSRTFGGSGEDEATSVQQTRGGGYIVAGSTRSIGAGSNDMYLVKTDPNGVEVWSRTFGGSGEDTANSVQQTTDGGYIMAGLATRFGAAEPDMRLVKTDPNGAEVWSRTFGGSGDDAANSVQQTTDGGYIVAGHTESTGAGEYDMYLVKTDPSGNEIWNRTFGGSGSDWAESVQQTTDGGHIVAGFTMSFGGGRADVYLIKTDRDGNAPALAWARTFGGGDVETANSVQQTSDGGYIVAGLTDSIGAGSDDMYLVKTDPYGAEVWSRTFGGSGDDRARSVQETADGGYIVAGYTANFGAGSDDMYLVKTDPYGAELGSATFGGGSREWGHSVQQTTDGGYILAGFTHSFGAGERDMYLVKTDPNGVEVWSRTFGGSDVDSAISVQQTMDGGYIVAGSTGSFGAGNIDMYLVKTDPYGVEVWSRTFGGWSNEGASSVQQTNDGGFIVAGSTGSLGAGSIDMYLVKTDPNGNEVWSRTFGGTGGDQASSVQQTADGGYIVLGDTTSFGAGESDMYLVKTDPDGVEVWSRTFGGWSNEWADSVQQTNDGGFIVAGWTWSFGAGECDVYLVKTDRYGYAPPL